jgi:hypothetical protein
VEREETSNARLQQPKQTAIAKLCKYVSFATEADATVEELLEKKCAITEELLEVVFSMSPP